MRLIHRLAVAAALLLGLAACEQASSAPTAPDVAATAPAQAATATPTEAADGPTDVAEEEPARPAEPSPDPSDGGGHGDHPMHDAARPSDDEADVVEVAMVDIAFEPERIEVPAGTPITLRVRNDGLLEHDLDLPAADLHLHGQPGEEHTGVLQIDAPGTYEAQCLIAGHAEAGMVMQVLVR